jgi:hypothetical protein
VRQVAPQRGCELVGGRIAAELRPQLMVQFPLPAIFSACSAHVQRMFSNVQQHSAYVQQMLSHELCILPEPA